MVTDTQKVNITKTEWTSQAAFDLKNTCTEKQLDNLYLESAAGNVEIWNVASDDYHYGTLVTRVENCNDGMRDLVLVFVAGDYMTLTSVASNFLEGLALFHKCERVRVHAVRKGIERALMKYGFNFSELILYRNVDYSQLQLEGIA